MRNMILIGAILSVGLISTQPMAANDNLIWSMNAMSCVPTPATLESGLIDARAGRVIFRDGKSGTAALICPIGSISDQMRSTGLRSLFLTYRDGDGNTPDSGGSVNAALRRIDRSTGHVETLPNAGVSSHGPNAPSSGPQGWATHQSATSGNTIPGGFDFGRFYYYVQIAMRRDGTSGPLAVQGVFLQN